MVADLSKLARSGGQTMSVSPDELFTKHRLPLMTSDQHVRIRAL